MNNKLKIKAAFIGIIIGTFLLNGCGEKVDNVINEMTLKGTVDRGEKTKDVLKKVQKQYAENLKELQKFDNPTNSLKSGEENK